MHLDRKGRRCARGAHAGSLHVYRPLAPRGVRARRERRDLDVARAIVKARSEGWCEAHAICERVAGAIPAANDWRSRVCGTILLHEGAHAHHVWPEDRDAGLHEAQRMRWLCPHAHDWVHRHPTAAAALGLLRPES